MLDAVCWSEQRTHPKFEEELNIQPGIRTFGDSHAHFLAARRLWSHRADALVEQKSETLLHDVFAMLVSVEYQVRRCQSM